MRHESTRDTRSKMPLFYSVENKLEYFSDTLTKIGNFGKNRHPIEKDLKYFSDNQMKIANLGTPVHAVIALFVSVCSFSKQNWIS